MAFCCQITGGSLKTVPDEESLASGWHSISTVKSRPPGIQLRCKDFLNILNAAVRFDSWKKALPSRQLDALKWQPILNRNEAQPGLFIEFVIIRTSSITYDLSFLIYMT
jgi:hypothetical protein